MTMTDEKALGRIAGAASRLRQLGHAIEWSMLKEAEDWIEGRLKGYKSKGRPFVGCQCPTCGEEFIASAQDGDSP